MKNLNFNEYFIYDQASPSCLVWKQDIYCGNGLNRLKVKSGTPAGTLRSNDYFTVKLQGVVYQSHRVIMQMFGNDPTGLDVDHLDGNPSNNAVENLRCVEHCVNNRNFKMNSKNTSGLVGVQLCLNGLGYTYWRASWYELSGLRRSKNFSVKRRGESEAFRLACEYRTKMIEELNLQGAGYTETHGIRESH